MRSLGFDFIKNSSPRWPGVMVLILGLIIVAVGYQRYQVVVVHATTLDRELKHLHGNSKAPLPVISTPQRPSAEIEAESRRAQQVAEFLQLPWDTLFSALEQAAQDDVALLAIEPEPKKRLVRITAEARDADTLFEYLKQLESVPELQEVHLMRHEIRDDDKQHPIRFTIGATWKTAS